MQFIAPAFGIVFLLIGLSMAAEFWANFKDFYRIYLGVFFLFIGYVHRLKWLHRKELREAWALTTKIATARNEEAEQGSGGNGGQRR